MARTSPADRGIPYFAAFLDLLNKKVVVVGGGRVATTKVRALLTCGPKPLWVVAPHASTFIQTAAARGQLVWLKREYALDDLNGAALAFGATDDRAQNARVAQHARQIGIPVLAVDDVPNCDFIAPALVRRGDMTIAISTGGRSPAMARRTRERLELALPASWADLLEVAASARDKLGSTRALIDADRWQTALDGEVERLAEGGKLEQATELLLRRLEGSLFEGADSQKGLVSLVGAGPGDADLLTLRALRRLQAADAVVHDRLVSDEVLAFARPDAERFDVGKASGGVGTAQTEINGLLIRLGIAGKRVVRLKGGDPFVFGRGGEEALALARAGVAWELVPGISSALAAPAAAGIPVTHRGVSASVTIVNGHDAEQHDWSALARGGGTLVFLMALEHLEVIAAKLLQHGRSADEPTAVVQWAWTPRQRIVTAGLADIAATARAEHFEAPAVLVVGPTAAVGEALRHGLVGPTAAVVDASRQGAAVCAPEARAGRQLDSTHRIELISTSLVGN